MRDPDVQEQKENIIAAFARVEDTLLSKFTDEDKEIIERERRRQEGRKKACQRQVDDDVDMDFIDLPDQNLVSPQSQRNRRSRPPSGEEKKRDHDYDHDPAVEFMEHKFGKAPSYRRFGKPLDVCELGDRREGDQYRVANRCTDECGSRSKIALDEVWCKAEVVGAKLPKVRDRISKRSRRQIEPSCDRGTSRSSRRQVPPSASFCQEYWNGPAAPLTAAYQDPPPFKPEVLWQEYAELSCGTCA